VRKTYIIFCLLLLISGCEIFDTDYDTYTIQNDTDAVVKILAFIKYDFPNELENPVLVDSIVIDPLNKYFIKKIKGEDDDPVGYFSSDMVDSVVVIFNDSKKIFYVCYAAKPSSCFNERNMMNRQEFSEIKCEKNRGCDYTYYITSEDYEAATDF
jgi:hypothetical protein